MFSSQTIACCAIIWITLSSAALAQERSVDFDRDIRPILSDNCFRCHGPDAAKRKGKLRLDTKEGSRAARDGGAAVVPGDPESSVLVERISSDDPDVRMPPPEAKKTLGEDERALLRRWIEEGADWSEHWALLPPEKSIPPKIEETSWARNPIDNFIADRLKGMGISHSKEASRQTLIRRLSLDLLGLPPTPNEVQAFLTDTSANAYERLVDRLLASPHYGERMAWPWLDAARYADTNGYQGDGERTMYPWRDWVIEAFNENIPFDQFTVWQLAGDLLPNATQEQKIATGFNRNHMINGEGGRIAEENRIEYIFDQIETVGTVWMGLTLNCCRCHDHKYDAITNEEYYQFFAFFNQTPVNGKGGDPKTAPTLTIHSPEATEKIAALTEEKSLLERVLADQRAELAPFQAEWERDRQARIENGVGIWSDLDIQRATAEHQTLTVQDDGAILATGENPKKDTYRIEGSTTLDTCAAIRLQALRHSSMTDGGLARSYNGNFVLSEFQATLVTKDGVESPLTLDRAVASFEEGNQTAKNALDGKPNTGWSPYEGHPFERNHEAIFYLEEVTAIPEGATIVLTLTHASFQQSHNLGHFKLSLSSLPEALLDADRRELAKAFAIAKEHRSEEQANQLFNAYLQSNDPYRRDERGLDRTEDELSAIDEAAVKVMIMEDMEEPRKTFILNKGLYNQRRGEVSAGLPAGLPDLKDGAPLNRLGLAEWLVDPQHPLTARVTVNRFWAQIFGQGLVRTAENFGVQGEMPSHPELLDWLAVTFIESGWDVKALLRLIATSSAYRQTSDTDARRTALDPDNRFLSRGSRYRMPSWMIRDQALFASNLFVPKIGGPPVKPYQPEGIWKEFSFGKKEYKRDAGESLYRRSLYTYWRRIVAPPMFFDSATRQTCSVKSKRTNTPLHALATLNDTTYVEAARAMALRVLTPSAATDQERINTAFRLTMARKATTGELALLQKSIARLREQFAADPEAATAYVSVGESKPPPGIDAVELAAYASLCLAILNTDEALTKE